MPSQVIVIVPQISPPSNSPLLPPTNISHPSRPAVWPKKPLSCTLTTPDILQIVSGSVHPSWAFGNPPVSPAGLRPLGTLAAIQTQNLYFSNASCKCSQPPGGPAGPYSGASKNPGPDGTAISSLSAAAKCKTAVLGLDGRSCWARHACSG